MIRIDLQRDLREKGELELSQQLAVRPIDRLRMARADLHGPLVCQDIRRLCERAMNFKR
jgi:hypothetical protein